MRYRTIIAIIDGVPNSQGDILTGNVILPPSYVRVSSQFTTFLGLAIITKESNTLVATMDIKLDKEIAQYYHGVVVGKIISRNGNVIEKWSVTEVGLTVSPSDTRLPKLEEII